MFRLFGLTARLSLRSRAFTSLADAGGDFRFCHLA
jgi:hypothetical protein